METVFYRKYRSRSFAEVIGQDHVVPILVQSIAHARLAHAYLFCGPRGTGKTTLARLMAKGANCENFTLHNDICNECSYCQAIASNESVDIVEMDAASNRGIEEIRSLKDTVAYMPTILKKKVYIIDEAHMLTKEAFNALLKTLEEPPSHVLFVLATTEPHKLPITILSRVQRYDLRLASENQLVGKLLEISKQESIEIDRNALKIIYKLSGGSYRDAESLLGKLNVSAQMGQKITVEDVYTTLGMINEEELVRWLNEITSGKLESALQMMKTYIEGSGSVGTLIDQALEVIKSQILNQKEDAKKFINLANLFIKTKEELRSFADKDLILELALIRYCTTNFEAPPVVAEVVSKVQTRAVEVPPAKKYSQPDTTDLVSLLEEHIASKGPRFAAIIKNSKLSLVGSTITIVNPHKLNVTYLANNDIKSIVTKVCLENNVKIKEVNLVVDGESETAKEESPVKSQKKPSATAKDQAKALPAKKKDNSTIVEKIL